MKKHFLIIDDDKLLNKINEKVLQGAGIVHELHFASNGFDGMRYLESRIEKNYPLPDLIILDLHMPVMDGFQFIAKFNAMEFIGKSKIELVIFTSSSSIKDKLKAQELGVIHYLNKPYLLRGLLDIVTRSKVGEI